jgi:hypothetical protein
MRSQQAASPASMRRTPRVRRIVSLLLVLAAAGAIVPAESPAQSRVGADSSTRTRRYRHDLVYGAALGFVYAGVDQVRNDPPEWGKGWHGYERRVASDIGEFAIQETVTDLLAAAVNRQLDYQRCHCDGTGRRIGWALQSAVTDPLPNGHRAFAFPRVIGAYAGSIAQASWRPATSAGRTRVALVNGTVSLLIGAGINLWYELR